MSKNNLYVAMLAASVVAGLLLWAAIYVIDTYVFEDAALVSTQLGKPLIKED